MGCYFYPRGGSAHAARALTRQLRRSDVKVTVRRGVARRHRAVRPGRAVLRRRGPPRRGLHAGARDARGRPHSRSAGLAADARLLRGQAGSPGHRLRLPRRRALRAPGRRMGARARARRERPSADVLYLNHLTPMNEAAAREFADIPVIGHIHGPELLMLERIAEGAPESWRYAEEWRKRICRWAAGCDRLVANTPQGARPRREAPRPRRRSLRRHPQRLRPGVQAARDRPPRAVAEAPGRGAAGLAPGRAARQRQLRRVGSGRRSKERPSLYSGRFTEVKRLPLLIEAYAKARVEFD